MFILSMFMEVVCGS